MNLLDLVLSAAVVIEEDPVRGAELINEGDGECGGT